MLKRAEKKENKEIKQNGGFSEHNNVSNEYSWFKKNKVILIIGAIVVFIIIIASISGNSSSSTKSNIKDYCPNGDYSSSYYDDTCGTKPDEKICRGTDGRYYDKPRNAYCDGSKTPQGWTCNNGYTAKSEGDRKRDHDSWYCECNSSYVKCSSYYDTQTNIMQTEINKQQNYLNNMYVNQYSQSSVNKYNSQVQYVNDLIGKRNRYMSENCTCSSY